jgi:DNA-binding transcriptional ArsR family regulator
MVAAANLVEVAALVGDTARATMLNALMGGQSLTATELAYCANVSRSTASDHLSKLVAARLLTVIAQSPLQLLSDRVPAGRDNAGEHQGCRRHRGATPPSPAVSKRRCSSVLPEVATITWLASWESLLPMHLLPWGTSYSPRKAVRSRLRASVSFPHSALI